MAADLFGEEVKIIDNPDAYAAMPGTGPDSKKCKDCDHYTRIINGGGYAYRKCGLVKSTCGAATDIKANSPACWRFTDEN